MITRHRQRNRCLFRLITIVVITAFLSQNIAWSAPTPLLRKETLAPNSEFARLASRIDLEMAGIGHGFIQWIKASNIHTLTQFESLLRKNPKVREDLYGNYINTIFYPGRIELISPKFTLVFHDNIKYPEAYLYQIPGTNIRMNLYKHPHLTHTEARLLPDKLGLRIEKTTKGNLIAYAAWSGNKAGASILGKAREDGYFAVLAINKVEDLETYKGIGLKLLIKIALDTRNQLKGISGPTNPKLAESMAKYFNGTTLEKLSDTETKFTLDFSANEQLLNDIENRKGHFKDKSMEELSFQELAEILLSYKKPPSEKSSSNTPDPLKQCVVSENHEEMSQKAAEHFMKEVQRLIKEKGRAVVCFACDRTSQRMYEIIQEKYINEIDWTKVTTFNLDEYVFPPQTGDLRNYPGSLRYDMEQNLFIGLRNAEHPLLEENIHFLNGSADDIDAEIERYKRAIYESGGIDLCILGIGRNAHLAFAEPGTPFNSTVHKVKLSETTLEANKDAFGGRAKNVPRYALTLGLQDITNARSIMQLARGKHKRDAIQKSIMDPVTEQVPSSILQTHPNVRYFLDKEAASKLSGPSETSQTSIPERKDLNRNEISSTPLGSYNPSNLMLHNNWLQEDDPVKILELYETMLAVGSDKALQEEYSGVAFGAGMAGIRTALATLLAKKKTDGPREVVVVQPCYGCTQNLAEEFESLGLIVQYVNETDTEKMKEQLQKRINKNTALVYFETPVNPTVKLVDIEAIVKEVKAKEEEYGQKIFTFIDNTFATSLAQKPLLMDIDVVVQVITKGETGSGNVLGSVIIAKKHLAEEIRRNREIMAESINKHDAETAIRYGIPYLHIRLPKQTENTKRIYDWLCAEMDKEDELVNHVSYPGEGDSKEKAIYRKQMMHQGHMLYFEFETEELAKHFMRLVRYFRMFEDAVSLGQIRTLVENPSGGTHAALSDSAQSAGGIKETGIRFSIGIEEGDDLIRELNAIFKILRLFKSDLSRIPYKKLDNEFMVKNHEGEYLIRKWPNDEMPEKSRQLDLFPDGKFMDRAPETARIIRDTTNIDTYQPINLVIHHAWIWALLSGAHRSVIGSANESTNYRWPDAEKCREDFGSYADLAMNPKFIPAGIWRIYARLGTQLSATIEAISALLFGDISKAVNLEFVGTSFPSENGAFWTLIHKRIEYINLRKIIAYLEKGGEDKYGLLQAYRNGGYIGFKGFLNTADMLDPYTSTTLRTRAEETDPNTKKEIVIITPPDSPLVGLAGTLKEVYRDSGVPIKIITDPSSLKGEDWLSSADLVFIDNLRMPGLDLEELTRQIKAKDNSILIGLTSTPNASYPGMSEADFTLSILYDQDRDRGAVLNYNRAIGDNKTWFDLGFGRKNVSYAPRDKDTILHILHNLPYLAVRTTRMKENAGRINQLLEAQSTIESTEYNESSHLIHFKLKNEALVHPFIKLLENARMIDFGKPLHRDQTTVQQSSQNPTEFFLSAGIEEIDDVLKEINSILITLNDIFTKAYKKKFAESLERLQQIPVEDFIPDQLKLKLRELNNGRKIRYYSFNSLKGIKRFCRYGYLLRRIKPDEVIVVRLILPGKYGKRIIITALRFGNLKEEALKTKKDVDVTIEWEKTHLLINRDFNLKHCFVKGEGLYRDPVLQGEGLGFSVFRLFNQWLTECGFGGYPYRAQIENPKLFQLVYRELNARINTTNIGLTRIFIDRFKQLAKQYSDKITELEEKTEEKAREFVEFLIGLYKGGVSLDWKTLKVPVEGTIPEADKPVACKFPGESDLTNYEKRDIERFIGRQKRQILDSQQLSEHRLLKKVIRILTDRTPTHHDPIKKALVFGKAVTVNAAGLDYRTYNDRQVHIRVCIVKSDIPNRKFFGSAKNRLGVPIYPTFEEKNGKLFLNLNILSALLKSPTITPEILTELIVHELSELLLDKNHIEAILEEKHYNKSEIPARLLWMIDESGRRAIGKNPYIVRVLKQLTRPYRLAGAYFGKVTLEIQKRATELSRLVTQRAQMWLDFMSLIRKSEKEPEKKLKEDTKNNLIKAIRNCADGTLEQDDINALEEGKKVCGVFLLGESEQFTFSIDKIQYICNKFGQNNETVIVGLIFNEKYGLCLWRFSPKKGTFKVFSLERTMANLKDSSDAKGRYTLPPIEEEKSSLDMVFTAAEEEKAAKESPEKTDDDRKKQPATVKKEDPETEAAFNKTAELIEKYAAFLKGRKIKNPLPLGDRTNTLWLPEETAAFTPFNFEVFATRKRRLASLASNRFTMSIPKKIGATATLGFYWHTKWGLWIWLSNKENNHFCIYRADLCLSCWDKSRKGKDIYTAPIAEANNLESAMKKAALWMERGITAEKSKEEAREIIREFAEVSGERGDMSSFQNKVGKFKGCMVKALRDRMFTTRPHPNNVIHFRRLGRLNEPFRLRFMLHKTKGLLAIFTSQSSKRSRIVVYSLTPYLDYDPHTKEQKVFDLYPIAEGEDYVEVMKRARITEEDIFEKVNRVIGNLGYRNLGEFISRLQKAPGLELLNAIKTQLPKLEEILEEAIALGIKKESYASLQTIVENLKVLTSPFSIWKRQFGRSEAGILELQPGTTIRYDVQKGRSMNFPDIDPIIGPATIEFTLQSPLQLKGLDDKNLKLELIFREGHRQAKKLFYLHIARKFLYVLGPDGERYTLSQLEDENVQKEISQAGPEGSISKCLADLFKHREALKDRAITIKNTLQPKDAPGWRSGNLGETTIRWELNRLAELGFLKKYADTKEHQFYITHKLLTASPEVIERICRLPELLHPSKFPKGTKERQGLKERIAQTYPQEDLLASDALNYYAKKKIKFLKRINEGDTIVLFYHEDADGVASCVLETLFLEKYFNGLRRRVNIQHVPILYSSYHALLEASIPEDAHIIALDINYYSFKEMAAKCGLNLTQRNKLIMDHHDNRMAPIKPGEEGDPEKDGWTFVSPKRCLGIKRLFPTGNLVRILNRAVLQKSQGKVAANDYAEHYAWIACIATYGDISQHENTDLIGIIRNQGINPLDLQRFAYRLNTVSQAGWGGSRMALTNLLKIAESPSKTRQLLSGESLDNLMWQRYRKRVALLEEHTTVLKERILAQQPTSRLLFYHLTASDCRINNRDYRLAEIMADILTRALPDKVIAVAKVLYGSEIKLELRTRASNDLDIGAIMANLYQGGGHKEAGGAEIELGTKDIGITLESIRLDLEREIAERVGPATSPDTERSPPEEQVSDMLSSREKLEDYIRSDDILELVPEWKDWAALGENKNYMRYHHLRPEEHLLIAFQRLESSYFQEEIRKAKLTEEDLMNLRRALFLHDLGEILVLRDDPSYSKESYLKHPEKSVELARDILHRLGYSPSEIEKDLMVIKYHSTLKDLAQSGHSQTDLEKFIKSIKNIRNLELLRIMQLIDAASVRHMLGNSLSIGLERRVNEICDMIKAILTTKNGGYDTYLKRLQDYLLGIQCQNTEIDKAFSRLKDVLREKKIEIDEQTLQEAFLAMHRSHLGQLRKDGKTPFVIHCIETAVILVEELGITNPEWIIATLLHDVLEDTRTNARVLEQVFGKNIVSMILLLSKPDINNYPNKYERDRDYMRRLIYGTDEINNRHILTAVQTIKIADRIHSLRTLDTKVKGFAKKKIDETYEIFIQYFIGETEVHVPIKQILIAELIREGKKRGLLTPAQIEILKLLSRKIIDFKIPDLETVTNPSTFIKGMAEYMAHEGPNKPLVFAFDGMSGVGRSTMAEKVKKDLEKAGRKVVIFDANDFLKQRKYRDSILELAMTTPQRYYEQRDELYNFSRFKEEVLDRIAGFRSSNEPYIEFKLSNIYDRFSGKLTAEKSYQIDRDTVILIEGIHVLQEEFLPVYDATFLVYAPKDVCRKNVVMREKAKARKFRQKAQTIKDRFEILDWPSYRKHLIEYWLASGFIIDNTDYRRPLLKRNPFPRYTSKAPWIPEEFVDPEKQLLRNLEYIFSQLKEKDINPEEIVYGTKDLIGILRNLLAVKDIDKLFPDNVDIPSPDADLETLDLFLDQIISQGGTESINIFFRLFSAYLLGEVPALTVPEEIVSLSIKNLSHLGLFRKILEQAIEKRRSSPPIIPSFWEEDREIPILLDIDSLRQNPSGTLLAITRLGINLLPGQRIHIILTHPSMNKAEVKEIFGSFYKSINLGKRDTKKSILRVSFELNNLHTTRKGFAKYLKSRFRNQRIITTETILLITTKNNYQDIYQHLNTGFRLINRVAERQPTATIPSWRRYFVEKRGYSYEDTISRVLPEYEEAVFRGVPMLFAILGHIVGLGLWEIGIGLAALNILFGIIFVLLHPKDEWKAPTNVSIPNIIISTLCLPIILHMNLPILHTLLIAILLFIHLVWRHSAVNSKYFDSKKDTRNTPKPEEHAPSPTVPQPSLRGTPSPSFLYPVCESDLAHLDESEYIGEPIIIHREIIEAHRYVDDSVCSILANWLLELNNRSTCLERFSGLSIQVIGGRFSHSSWRTENTIFIGTELIEIFQAVSGTPGCREFGLYEFYKMLVHESKHNGKLGTSIEDKFLEELMAVDAEVDAMRNDTTTRFVFDRDPGQVRQTLKEGWSIIARWIANSWLPEFRHKTRVDDFNTLIFSEEDIAELDIAELILTKDRRFLGIKDRVLEAIKQRRRNQFYKFSGHERKLQRWLNEVSARRQISEQFGRLERKYMRQKALRTVDPKEGTIPISDKFHILVDDEGLETIRYALEKRLHANVLYIKDTETGMELYLMIFVGYDKNAKRNEKPVRKMLDINRDISSSSSKVAIFIDEHQYLHGYTIETDRAERRLYLCENGKRLVPLRKNRKGQYVLDLREIQGNIFLDGFYGRRGVTSEHILFIEEPGREIILEGPPQPEEGHRYIYDAHGKPVKDLGSEPLQPEEEIVIPEEAEKILTDAMFEKAVISLCPTLDDIADRVKELAGLSDFNISLVSYRLRVLKKTGTLSQKDPRGRIPKISPELFMRVLHELEPGPATISERIAEMYGIHITYSEAIERYKNLKGEKGGYIVRRKTTGTMPPARAHRFQKKFREVLARKMEAAGFSTGDIERVLNKGLARTVGNDLQWEKDEIIAKAAEALNEILFRSPGHPKYIEPQDVKDVVSFHERIHILLTPEITGEIIDRIKNYFEEGHTMGKGQIKDYPALLQYFQNQYGEYEDELEIIEELIANIYMEKLLGNPLRLLNDQGESVEIEGKLLETIDAEGLISNFHFGDLGLDSKRNILDLVFYNYIQSISWLPQEHKDALIEKMKVCNLPWWFVKLALRYDLLNEHRKYHNDFYGKCHAYPEHQRTDITIQYLLIKLMSDISFIAFHENLFKKSVLPKVKLAKHLDLGSNKCAYANCLEWMFDNQNIDSEHTFVDLNRGLMEAYSWDSAPWHIKCFALKRCSPVCANIHDFLGGRVEGYEKVKGNYHFVSMYHPDKYLQEESDKKQLRQMIKGSRDAISDEDGGVFIMASFGFEHTSNWIKERTETSSYDDLLEIVRAAGFDEVLEVDNPYFITQEDSLDALWDNLYPFASTHSDMKIFGNLGPKIIVARKFGVHKTRALSRTFTEKVISLTTMIKEQLKENEELSDLIKIDIERVLKECIETPQNEVTQAIAWHVLARIAQDEQFKGNIVYSLNTLLESELNDGNLTPRLKNLLERTKGKVVFYTGNGCLDHHEYNFLKESLVTTDEIADLVKQKEPVIFMLNEEHRKQLGINELTPGQLIGNQFVVPIEYLVADEKNRNTETDILLGLEILKNEGIIKNRVSSLFYTLLRRAVKQWLEANGRENTPQAIQEIMGHPPVKQYDTQEIEDSYRYIQKLITSA